MVFRVEHCSDADKDHKKRKRQYAHTWHRDNKTICVAEAFFGLPIEHQAGLIAHEIGHLLMGPYYHEEYEADLAAMEVFGIAIRYKTSKYGDFLQYLNKDDVRKFLKEVQSGKTKTSL